MIDRALEALGGGQGGVGALVVAGAAAPLVQRAQAALAVAVASGSLAAASRRLPPGPLRAVACLPSLVAAAATPLLFSNGDELVARVAVILISVCANLKVLALCMGRGALAVSPWSLVQFLFLYTVPVYPKDTSGGKRGRLSDSAGSAANMITGFVGHMAVVVVCIVMLDNLAMPAVARYYACAFGIYGFVSALMTGPGALVTGLLSLDVVPPFDKPWLSTSLADYWSKRWNNSINLMLRTLVFDPIVERRAVKAPPPPPPAKGAAPAAAAEEEASPPYWLRITGVVATFVASGLVHELMCVYLMKPYRFGWALFFFVQAPLVLLERKAWQAVKAAGLQPSWLMRCFVTQCLLVAAAHTFFFPPIEKWTNVAQQVIQACAALVYDGAAGAQGAVRGVQGAAAELLLMAR